MANELNFLSETMLSGYLQVVGSAIGAGLGFLGGYYMAKRSAHESSEIERTKLAIALREEILSISHGVAACSSMAVKELWGREDSHFQHYFRSCLPAAPMLYPALASKILLLRPETCGPVIQFYADLAETLHKSERPKSESFAVEQDWLSLCHILVAAVKALDAELPAPSRIMSKPELPSQLKRVQDAAADYAAYSAIHRDQADEDESNAKAA
jgi:hypothetical protein